MRPPPVENVTRPQTAVSRPRCPPPAPTFTGLVAHLLMFSCFWRFFGRRCAAQTAVSTPVPGCPLAPNRGVHPQKYPPQNLSYTPGQSHPHARKSPGAISPAAGKCCARRNSPHSIAQTYTPTCCAEEVWSNMARPRPAWQLKVGPRRPCRRPSADAPSLGCHRPSAAPMRSDLDVPKVL